VVKNFKPYILKLHKLKVDIESSINKSIEKILNKRSSLNKDLIQKIKDLNIIYIFVDFYLKRDSNVFSV
jgi:hypothetical protein